MLANAAMLTTRVSTPSQTHREETTFGLVLSPNDSDDEWRGPVFLEPSVCLMLARQLKREVIKRDQPCENADMGLPRFIRSTASVISVLSCVSAKSNAKPPKRATDAFLSRKTAGRRFKDSERPVRKPDAVRAQMMRSDPN
jgi:hypothetical protein